MSFRKIFGFRPSTAFSGFRTPIVIKEPCMQRSSVARRMGAGALLASSLSLALAACQPEPVTRGYVLDQQQLQQVKIGDDEQKVLQTLGTPSTVSTVGGMTWFYISQQTVRRFKFMNPTIVDQRVLAVSFDKNKRVERIASYGMQDGVVFDFISRTTPTGGDELSIVKQLMRATGQFGF
jgi:outer membrane protein assembly factor BamE (lipoprotein component of BamABCDE complex)